jgi:hypothetical protein
MRALPIVLVVLVAVGCSSNKGKLEGTRWTSEEITVRGHRQLAGYRTLEFKDDGTMVYQLKGQPTVTSRWSLSPGSNVVFRFEEPLGGRKVHTEKITIDGDTLTMTDSDGTSISFTRLE